MSHKQSNKLTLLGALPPPIFGLSAVNAAVQDALLDDHADIIVINTSAKGLNRSLLFRLLRFPVMLKALLLMGFRPALTHSTLYMSLSGGWGQFYECLFLLFARARRMRIIIHHHSFAYLTQPSRLTWLVTRLAGRQCLHIALCPGMATTLQNYYSAVQRVVVLSNTVFINAQSLPSALPHKQLKTIGFISNISAEKGILTFLDIAQACEQEDLPVSALIAGPYESDPIRLQVENHIHSLSSVRAIGPQYGDDKARFFAQIDVLIFPTNYKNEAEPLILYEAMENGIPVITYGRGCIADRLSGGAGLVIDPEADFITPALNKIRQWLTSPDDFQRACEDARQQITTIRQENTITWEALKRTMITQDEWK